MYSRPDRIRDLYEAFDEMSGLEEGSIDYRKIKEIASHAGEVPVFGSVAEKAIIRSEVTEFETQQPTETPLDSRISAEEVNVKVERKIYVRSYEIDENGGKIKDRPASVYNMYVDRDRGVPFCSCPEMEKGGLICHHMIVHAMKSNR